MRSYCVFLDCEFLRMEISFAGRVRLASSYIEGASTVSRHFEVDTSKLRVQDDDLVISMPLFAGYLTVYFSSLI